MIALSSHDGSALKILENVPLAPRTTIGAGGQARYFLIAQSRADLRRGIRWAGERGVPLLVLGGGSNLLPADEGFAGLVIQIGLLGISSRIEGNQILVRAMAGEPWDGLVALATSRNWAGIECLSGIPGLAGAAPIQNIGAYGQEVAQTIARVEVLNVETLKIMHLTKAACGFSYRNSLFKGEAAGRFIVTAVEFLLQPDGPPNLSYPDLSRMFGASPALEDVRRAVLQIRSAKSMVIDPADPNARGCGSFFLNPVLDAAAYQAFRERCDREHPAFAAPEGRTKLAAAWLIENAGFAKGFARGRVGLSQRHALAVINRGGATAREIRAFAAEIRDAVHARFGVNLEPEPLLLTENGAKAGLD